MIDTDDTIVAIASPAGTALRGVVRMSGKDCLRIAESCMEFSGTVQRGKPSCGKAVIELGSLLGRVDVEYLLWPGQRSYTGQPVLELHLNGSPPLLNRVVVVLTECGARGARPGEFTLRAFLAGRLDLMQCEAVLGVIDAEGETSLRQALTQLAGGMSGALETARNQLMDALAEIEAGLDFAEEDLQFITSERLRKELDAVARVVSEARSRMRVRHLSGEAYRVVLMGLPNAGKSSLLNAIVGRDAAIVSSIAGTTRDWVTAVTEEAGLRIQWIDTAGLEPDAGNELDQRAQATGKEQIEQAHLRLLCIDTTRATLEPWEELIVASSHANARTLIVGTKCDVPTTAVTKLRHDAIRTSCHTGLGIELLKRTVREVLTRGDGSEADPLACVASTAQRCAASLDAVSASIDAARELVGRGEDELLAAELRLALDALGEVTGRIVTDDILDRIFSRFCIGK